MFRSSSNEARLDREGETAAPPPDMRRALDVGGRCETQSWTRSETFGLDWRFAVFLEAGLVVITIVGVSGENCEVGR